MPHTQPKLRNQTQSLSTAADMQSSSPTNRNSSSLTNPTNPYRRAGGEHQHGQSRSKPPSNIQASFQ